jgi:hypothetical protein
MIQTYQGYFLEDGRFITDGLSIILPVKRRAVVNILDDEVTEDREVSPINAAHRQKATSIKQILADAAESEGALNNDEWQEMANLRSQTNAGLSRTIDA